MNVSAENTVWSRYIGMCFDTPITDKIIDVMACLFVN